MGKALLCSLALHALVFLFLSWFRQGSPLPPPPLILVARLVKPTPPPEPPKAEPAPETPRAAPVAKPMPRQVAPPSPTPVVAVEAQKRTAEPAPVIPAAPVAAAPAAPPAVAAPTVSSGPDPGSVARFRLELMDLARRYKRYPRIAQDNNWEGRVELRIAYAENGSIASLTVKKGAGRQVLDEEAQAMIRSAQARATIPPALRGKAFVLEIPVDFSLDESR